MPAAVCSASASTLLGVFVTPVLVNLIVVPHSGAGASLDAIGRIFLQLLVPFAAGHFLRPWIGGFVKRHGPVLMRIDRGSILLVVYTAFGAAVVEGLWSRVSGMDLAMVLLLCCVLLAIVLGATWGAARAMKLPREDAIVLLFCGSKKSLASGVPMAGVLFPAAQVGLVILPLMLFHQLQLVACALIARRLADSGTED